jgi:hypothetical protein
MDSTKKLIQIEFEGFTKKMKEKILQKCKENTKKLIAL